MDLPDGDGAQALDDFPVVVFTPMASDGIGWLRITEPQRDPRAACMSVAALIHLLQPGVPLSELQARAETAIRALEDSADSAAVIDDMHRVERVFLHPGASSPDLVSRHPAMQPRAARRLGPAR